MTRYREPFYQPGATRFTDDRAFSRPSDLMTLIVSSPAWPALRDATTVPHQFGRRRAPGDWSLMYFMFVCSGQIDMEPWWTRSEDDLWRRAGFAGRPGFTTTYTRFIELEAYNPAFQAAAAQLIAIARSHEPRIGQHIMIDSTEAESHSALVHDCGADPTCPNNRRGKTKTDHAPIRPRRIATEDHRRARHEEAELDEALAPKSTDKITRRAICRDARGRAYLRLRVGKHWFRTRDLDAGARAYTSGAKDVGAYRFWLGFYNQSGVDTFTGAPMAMIVDTAFRQEYDLYPDLYAQLEANLGHAPQTIVADKGFAAAKVHEHNTRRGVATITPRRSASTTPRSATGTASPAARTADQRPRSCVSRTVPARACGSPATAG